MKVNVTGALAQIVLSFGVPEFSVTVSVPVGTAFTFIKTGLKVLEQE